jgi:membrane fusion protein (multidrug efflux system)
MKKILAVAALLGGLALFAYLRNGTVPGVETPGPSAAVSIVHLTQQSLPSQIPAFGSILAGAAEMSITLDAPGVVTDVLVRPGQSVAARQEIAQIAPDAQSTADLRKAQDAVQAAQAARTHVAVLLAGHLATTADLAAATQVALDAAANLQALRELGTGAARVLRAPFAGTVTSVTASRGGTSAAGSILFKLAAPAKLVAVAGLTEMQAERVRPGNAATITALNSNTSTAAVVLQRAAMLDPQTGLVDITLVPQSALLLGEPLALNITAGSVTGYAVPRDAVLDDEQGDYVFQLDAMNVAHRKTVRVLEANGAMTVLAPDLDPSMPLVTTGAYQLADGMAASVQGNGH